MRRESCEEWGEDRARQGGTASTKALVCLAAPGTGRGPV